MIRRIHCFYIQNEKALDAVGTIAACALLAYVAIVCWSLAEISNGAEISYSPFWHGPARWLLQYIAR